MTLQVSNDYTLPTIGDLITVSGKLELDVGGDLTMADIIAGRLDASAGGAVTGGDIDVTDRVGVEAQGAITLGDITAGPGLPTSENDFSVAIGSNTSITVGNITAAGDVGFVSFGALGTGDITAGDLVMAMVTDDITLARHDRLGWPSSISPNSSMFALGGGVLGKDTGDFDPNVVLVLDPVATSGSITINGTVTTGRIQAAAGTGLSVNDVSASDLVELSAGGLADFIGTVSAPTITVTSGDINVGEGAWLGVLGVTQLITLNAVSDGTPVIIGTDTDSAPAALVDGMQYHFGDEPGDIAADAIVFNAIGASEGITPDFLVYDAHIDGTATDGGGSAALR